MKKAKVYMHNKVAGTLIEDENGYHFSYDDSYFASDSSEPISVTLPLSTQTYHSLTMFPFFDGLIKSTIEAYKELLLKKSKQLGFKI